MARRSRPSPASFLSSLAAEWAWLLPVHRAYLSAGSLAGALIALLILGAGAGAEAGAEAGSGAGASAAQAIFTGRVSSFSAPWPAVLTLLTLSAFAAFGAATVWLTIADTRERRLPNVVLLGGSIALMVPLSLDVAVGGDVARLGYIWLVAAVFGLLMLVLWFGLPGQIGAGDVKLAPAAVFLPAWSVTAAAQAGSVAIAGEIALAVFAFTFCLCAALLVSAFIMLIRRSRDLAFGPVMLAASWATVLACPALT